MNITRLALGYASVLVVFLLLADIGTLRPAGRWVNAHPPLDKLIHFLMYGGLALLVNAALAQRTRWSLVRAIATGSIVVAIASTVEEYSNLLTIARGWSLGDIAANYLGIICLGILPLVGSASQRSASQSEADAADPVLRAADHN
jgi:VanZ family protein